MENPQEYLALTFYLSVHNEQTAAISIPLSDGSCSSFSVLWILLFLL